MQGGERATDELHLSSLCTLKIMRGLFFLTGPAQGKAPLIRRR